MTIFHIISAALCASPVVSQVYRWFFPYSFLGYTLFFLSLLFENKAPHYKAFAWALWASGLLALVFANPLWYQISLCLFLAVQALSFGLPLGAWYAQTATLTGFFTLLAGVFSPFGLYTGTCLLILVLLFSQKKQFSLAPKEPSIEP